MAIEYASIPAPSTIGLVTQQHNGLMSSVDKVKLDGLDFGASAYPLVFTAIVNPSSSTEVARLPVNNLPSFTYFVDLDDALGGIHFQVDAKKVGGDIDYVRSNVLGSSAHTSVLVFLDNTDIVFTVTNNHVSEQVNVNLKVI